MDDLSQFLNDPSAAPILALMREGRWRKARDAAKELCKRDRARYLVLLIEANVGLARELIDKGLSKDAITVIAYLETIAPPAVVTELRAKLASPVAKQAEAPLNSADLALGWAAVLRVDEALTNGATPSPADWAEVDVLVTDSSRQEPKATDERSLRIARELTAVRAAADATGDGQWEVAQEALRGIPGHSVFRYWRLFLRGVRCHFQDQPETVRQCFSGLPPNGALARAARALAPGQAPPGPKAPANARISLLLAMTGQPAAWAPAILAANNAWQQGKSLKAFDDLTAGMKSAFPAIAPGLPALLTEAVSPFRLKMDHLAYARCDQFTDRFDIWDDRRARSFPESVLAIAQPMALASAMDMSPRDLESCWGRVIELWNRCDGLNPLRNSLAWQWLGEILLKPGRGGGLFGPPPPDFAKVRAALDKAVNADPNNEAAWTSLIRVYERSGDTKARNRLLDDLAKRFPNNKSVLVQTGTLAIERKAYEKGLKALRAALTLDPLDREVKTKIASALILQIREYISKARSPDALWQQLEPLLEDRTSLGYLSLCRWMARVRRALLDRDPDTAQAAFDDSVRLAPSALERLFFEKSCASLYGQKLRKAWQQDWNQAALADGLRWATLLRLLEYHEILATQPGWDSRVDKAAFTLESELCGRLTANAFKLDLDGLLAFSDFCNTLPNKVHGSFTTTANKIVRLVVRAVDALVDRKESQADPRLRLFFFLTDEREINPLSLPKETLFKTLKAIIADAEAGGMADVAKRTKALHERMEKRLADAQDRDEDEYDDDDEFEDDDDEFDEDEDEHDDSTIPDIFTIMEALKDAIHSGNNEILDSVRNKLREQGVSDLVIDIVLNNLNSKKAKAARPKPPKPPTPPKVDPNQFDLF